MLDAIIKAQRKEIAEMKTLIADLQSDPSPASTRAHDVVIGVLLAIPSLPAGLVLFVAFAERSARR